MVTRVEIRCINKRDRTNHYERILNIGGKNQDGKPWKMPESEAIRDIKNGTYTFYVNQGGKEVDVIIAKSQFDHVAGQADSHHPGR